MLLLLVSAYSYSTLVEAADNTVPKITVNQNQNSIDLSWDMVGDLFNITDNEGNIIYSGTENNYSIGNLEEDSVVSYNLISYQGDEVLDSVQIITTTKGNDNQVMSLSRAEVSPELDTSINSFSSGKFVNLEWNDTPGVNEYRVYRDQELIATTNESAYTDTTVSGNSKYTYEIEFSVPLTEAEKEEVRQFYADQDQELTETEIENISNSRPVSIIRVVNTSSAQISALAAVNASFSWSYKTFIPMKYADSPVPIGKIVHFGGDDRSFSFDSEKYRTKMWAKTVFESFNSTHSFSKNIGITTAYDENYKLLDSKYASDEFMYGTKNSHSYTKADYTYYHKSGNPFIPVIGQEIDYQMRVITNSNGTYSFEGLHDRAPSHELYLSLNNGVSNRMIFAHPHEGFEYLGAPSPLARYFSISGSI